MERKIDDIFTFKGNQFKVIEGDCDNCYFRNLNCLSSECIDLGECTFRNDGKTVCFKLIEE